MTPRLLLRAAALLLRAAALLLLPLAAHAQIIIDPPLPRPRPEQPVELRTLELDGRVQDQVAEVSVTQTLYNPNGHPVEASFLFPVPPEAAVQDLVLVVDGQEIPGEVLPKDEARRRYEEIVRRMVDPALMEYAGYGLFQTSVFPIAARGESRVHFRYTELLPRQADRVRFLYPFAGARALPEVGRLRIGLTLAGEVGAIYSPSHDVEIEREDGRARVRFETEDVALGRDFQLFYTPAAEGPVSATLLSHWPRGAEDGYFLLLAAPEVPETEAEPLPKTVVFVLDRSGSMSGEKLEQARAALRFVLNNLHRDDHFNVVVYDDRVEVFRPELQRYSPDTRRAALDFVDGVRPGGSTNIDAALGEALAMLPEQSDRPAYVLFLTDGLPTAGETREAAIAQNAADANRAEARVFAFGVGYDVNARLLERLARGSGGTTEYVRPQEDVEASVARFYGRLSAPVLSDLQIAFDGTRVNRAYPRDLPDLFAGSQVVWAGRYTEAGAVTVRLSGRAGAATVTLRLPAELAAEGERTRHAFVEPLWATRRVADLLDQIDLHGQSDELVEELVALATQYGILTPYTSFLAEENAAFAAREAQLERAQRSLQMLSEVSGASGVEQRAARSAMAGADQVAAAPMAYDAEGRARRVETVRTVGTRAFYRRGDVWVDAQLLEREPEDVTEIEPFSDAYFALARQLPDDLLPYLTFREEVLVELQGQVYRIRPTEE